MSEAAVAGVEQIVIFRLGDQEFGLDISLVREIIRLAEITPMPNVPPAVAGMINVRGKIIPVVDLHKYLNLPPVVGPAARIVVIDSEGAMIGLQVDAATDVVWVSSDSLEAADEIVDSGSLTNIKGVYKLGQRLVALLEIEDILSISTVAHKGKGD